MIEVEQVRELLSKATPGPWAYRLRKYDDWGFVRASNGHLTAQAWDGAGDHESEEESDPAEGNARLIAAAPDIAALALAQAAEIARLREALEGIKEHVEAGVCVDDAAMLQRIDFALEGDA